MTWPDLTRCDGRLPLCLPCPAASWCLAAAVTQVVLSEWPPQALANGAWALARMGCRPPTDWIEILLAACYEQRGGLAAFEPEELLQVRGACWCCALYAVLCCGRLRAGQAGAVWAGVAAVLCRRRKLCAEAGRLDTTTEEPLCPGRAIRGHFLGRATGGLWLRHNGSTPLLRSVPQRATPSSTASQRPLL